MPGQIQLVRIVQLLTAELNPHTPFKKKKKAEIQ